MIEATTTRQLLDLGYTATDLARMVRSGSWSRLRRGAYRLGPVDGDGREEQHRRLIHAAASGLRVDSVLSDASAAVLHGLPVPYAALDRVSVTRDPACTGRVRADVHLHAAPLPACEVTEVDGIPVTTLARTAVDLARRGRADWALAAGDAALRRGMTDDDVRAVLARMRRWPGIRQARRVSTSWDARAESAGESLTRARLIEVAFPAAELQHVITDRWGRHLGTVDLAWPDLGVVVEFDGAVKYGRLVPDGEAPADVVVREKRREDAIRAQNWVVVRICWDQLWVPGAVAREVRAGFVLARQTVRRPT